MTSDSNATNHIKIKITRVLSLLASLCIGAYFLAFFYALSGVDPTWSKFFMGNVLWFLYLPFVLGLVYFYMRVQLGRWLLKEGAVGAAFAWSSQRLAYHFWLRGKREALIHRLVTARVHLLRGEYDEARVVLWRDEPLPTRSPELLELDTLRALWAMRVENIKEAREAASMARKLKRPASFLAMRLAILAECEIRARRPDEARALLEESRWLASTPYANFVEVLLAASGEEKHAAEALWSSKRDEIARALEALLPGALPEFWIACGTMLGRKGELEQGEACVRRAGKLVLEDGVRDPRSRWCWHQLVAPDARSRASRWARDMARGPEGEEKAPGTVQNDERDEE